jgi:sec-independent protein translocase protein TatC
MTFGEHLEELRWSLIKAIGALLVGFLIGLYPPISAGLVAYVQTPLRESLKGHYTRLAEEEYLRLLEEMRDAGQIVPADLEAAAAIMAAEGLIPDERYVDARAALIALAEKFPDVIDLESLPPADVAAPLRNQLLKLNLFHELERDPRLNVIGLRMEEPFIVYVKAAFVLGFVLSSPFVFYFVWQFVAAGLYAHERQYVKVFLPFSLGLFLAGAALAYFVAIHFVLKFMLWFYELMGIDPDPRISDWLSFVLILPLGFGISFQLPLVMLFLERIGIFTVATYKSSWRISILVITFLSMILTPSDPQSMLIMAIPLTILYFGGILLCQWMPRRTTPFGETID